MPMPIQARASAQPSPRGHLIAFEGLDQSGKQTQAERLAAAFRAAGHRVDELSFPDYHTAIGAEIGNALQGRREYAADTMQLLYIANRYEYRPQIEEWLAAGAMVICDRYLASSIAYGEAQGLDSAWLIDTQRHLPQPSVTHPARHSAGRVAAAQAGRPRQVRARPGAAGPGSLELPAAERRRRLGAASTATRTRTP